ncbi:mandelate racemase/muconate lactonizing enzyme family protein [Secundilactobacillus oryzae]|nr:enolase C-terminal domain-like protein [Secundilactobacillus oryzae]
MDDQIVGHTALKAGIDLALYDLLGKQANLPLYKLLGGASNQVTTDITISINPVDKMVSDAQKYVAQGFSELKIKAGLDNTHDEKAIAAILEAVDDDTVVKLDANQGWTSKQAVRFMNRFNNTKLEMLEQPLPYTNTSDNALIRQNISQDLILDESVHDAHDAFSVLQNRAADVVNIKLMKSKGIFGAEQINRVAEAAGVACMIGCMAETRLGIAAAVHFAAAHKNVHYCDLDSFMMFKEPDWLSGGFEQNGDVLTLTEAPGLGINLEF